MNRRQRCIASILGAGALLMAACGGDDPAPTPTATTTTATVTATSTATAISTPSLEELQAEVEAAYLAYWDAYADAVLHLDVSRLEGFAHGEELESISDEIESLRADGVGLRVRVEHDIAIVDLSDARAFVVDQIVDNSFYVDAATLLPEEAEGSGEQYRDAITLERVNGRWMVTAGSRDPGGGAP